ANGRGMEIPASVTVWDFRLPETPTLITEFGSPIGGLRNYYHRLATNEGIAEPTHWSSIAAACAEVLSEHRLNATPPSDLLSPESRPDGTFGFSPERLDTLREFIR